MGTSQPMMLRRPRTALEARGWRLLHGNNIDDFDLDDFQEIIKDLSGLLGGRTRTSR